MKYHTLFISKIRRDVAKFVVCCSCDLVVCCRVAVSVLSLFLAVPWVGLWSVIVFVCLIRFFTSYQQSFRYKGTGLPGLNQY